MLTDGWPVTAGIDPATGNPDVAYTSDEHAAILAGLIVRDIDGSPRAGVLPRHTNPLTTGRPDMKVDINPFEAVLVNAGVRFIALTETVTRDIAAAPVANTRYDISYVEVTDRALTGVISTKDVKIATGNAAAIPQDPPVPAGAVRLERIAVSAGATATNSGVTITPIAQFTAASGGVILFRSLAEMKTWTPPRGQLGRIIGSRGNWEYDGTTWLPQFPIAGRYAYRQNVGSGGSESIIAQTPTLQSGSSFMSEAFTYGTGGFTAKYDMEVLLVASAYDAIGSDKQSLNMRAFWRSKVNNASFAVHDIQSNFENEATVSVRVRLSKDQTLGFNAFQSSGATHTMVLDPTVTVLGPA